MYRRLLLTLLVLLPLLGGATCQPKKPVLPPATTAEHVTTEKLVFVPIDANLTAHPDAVPEGPVSKAIDVARERKALLLACWGQLDEIRAIEGTPAKSATSDADSD